MPVCQHWSESSFLCEHFTEKLQQTIITAIKIFLFHFFRGGGGEVKMCEKITISPFLRLQMRAKEDFNRLQFFPQISNT